MMCGVLTSGCTGQFFAVTFCAKKRTKATIKKLLGEPGVKLYCCVMRTMLSSPHD